jgi:hypothetical protein
MVTDGSWSSSGIMISGVKPRVPGEKYASVALLPPWISYEVNLEMNPRLCKGKPLIYCSVNGSSTLIV